MLGEQVTRCRLTIRERTDYLRTRTPTVNSGRSLKENAIPRAHSDHGGSCRIPYCQRGCHRRGPSGRSLGEMSLMTRVFLQLTTVATIARQRFLIGRRW